MDDTDGANPIERRTEEDGLTVVRWNYEHLDS